MAETITVACKHPHGLVLRLFEMVEAHDPLPGGGTKTVKRASPLPQQQVTIRGYLNKYDPALPPAARDSKFGLTHGVDKEFFDKWMAANKDHSMVQNNLIWAYTNAKGEGANDPRNIKAKAKEFEGVKCGLEPIDPHKLKGRLTTADEQKFPLMQEEDA